MKANKSLPKLKLSLQKETLRPLADRDLELLDSVVGGAADDTCVTTCNLTCYKTLRGIEFG